MLLGEKARQPLSFSLHLLFRSRYAIGIHFELLPPLLFFIVLLLLMLLLLDLTWCCVGCPFSIQSFVNGVLRLEVGWRSGQDVHVNVGHRLSTAPQKKRPRQSQRSRQMLSRRIKLYARKRTILLKKISTCDLLG